MNINKVTNGQNPQIQAQKIAASTETGKLSTQSASVDSSSNAVESKLIQKLNISSVESNEKNLDQVKASFQAGEYLTRESAESTAASILDQ